MANGLVDATIGEGRVQIVTVFGRRRNDSFTYTVGRFRLYGKPELLIVGMCGPPAASALEETGALVDAERPRDQAWLLPLCDLRVRVQTVERRRVKRFMLWAIGYYGGLHFPALEVLPAHA